MTGTQEVIDTLVADAGPVRRLRPPLLRAGLWLLAAVVVIGLLGLHHGPRGDLADRLGQPGFALGMAAAALTGALAAMAAFLLSLPDRSRAWAWLPVPSALLWLGSVGVGCLTDWVRIDDGNFAWGAAASCFALLVLASVPLSALMFWMLRHAARFRPTAVVASAGLAVAALSACALSLLHTFEASAMILLWNFGTAALVMGANAALARRMLR